MTEHDDVHEPLAIETLELAFHPLELFLITGNVGVKSEHERIAIAKRISRITR